MSFAFRVSLVDMIRKLGYRYTDPVDFLDTFISAAYKPGANVQIRTASDQIQAISTGTIDDKFFKDASQNIFSKANVIPPVSEYTELTVWSGKHLLHVDSNRHIEIDSSQNPVNGTRIQLKRKKVGDETERLTELYHGSDMNVAINSKPVTSTDFRFQTPEFAGTINYSPFNSGGIRYYQNGRFVSTEPSIRGVSVAIHQHNFPVTITKSKVIVKNKALLEKAICQGLTQYLTSDEVLNLGRQDPQGYQTLLRLVFDKYSEDPAILGLARKNIRFASEDGRTREDFSLEYMLNHPENLLPLEENLFHRLTLGNNWRNGPEKRPQQKSRKPLYAAATAIALGIALAATSITNDYFQSSKSSASAHPTSLNKSEMGASNIISDLESEVQSGGNYLSPEEFKSIFRSRVKEFGYSRKNTSNHLHRDLTWDDNEPTEKLQVEVETELPADLKSYLDKSDREKLSAVKNYILREFKYGILGYSEEARHSSFLEATVAEKKAICSSANTYAAILLNKLRVDNVRYATGLKGGVPHAWLETKRRNGWERLDCTPIKMDENTRRLISEDMGIQDALEGLVETINSPNSALDALKYAGVNDYISNPGTQLYMGGSLVVGLSLAGLLLGGANYLGKRLLPKRRISRSFDDTKDPYCTQLGYLLGMEVNPSPIKDTQYNPKTNTLDLPQGNRNRNLAKHAVELSIKLQMDDKQKLEVYRRIAETLK